MNRNDLRRKIIKMGAIAIRRSKHETFILNGKQIQIPSSGKEMNWRLEKKIIIQLRRAVKNIDTCETNTQ